MKIPHSGLDPLATRDHDPPLDTAESIEMLAYALSV
jgi:hypothetical protein